MFQQQSLVLALVCFAATLLYGVVQSPRGSWLSRAITVNLGALAVIFSIFAAIEVNGERSEIAAALVSELPFGVVVSFLCVAQAGYLPLRIGGPPLAVVAGRPGLRLLLASAAITLPASWLVAAAFGFVWPSPAVQALAPAPLEFVVFKCILMIPAAFYAGFAAALFLRAARSATLDTRLRFKNTAFASATCCLALVAVESAVFAGVRVWLPGEERVAALNTLMTAEKVLAIACVGAFLLGVALRYTPAVAPPLVRQAATRWLPEQDRFDSLRWRAVVGGDIRGVVRATHRIKVAADRLGLAPVDTERAIGTIQHIAAIRAGRRDPDAVTLERARTLHGLQSEVVREAALVRRIGEIGAYGTTLRSGPESTDGLHVELDAALSLTAEVPGGRDDGDKRPVWFYLAAICASEVELVDAAQVRSLLGDGKEYEEVLETCNGTRQS